MIEVKNIEIERLRKERDELDFKANGPKCYYCWWNRITTVAVFVLKNENQLNEVRAVCEECSKNHFESNVLERDYKKITVHDWIRRTK